MVMIEEPKPSQAGRRAASRDGWKGGGARRVGLRGWAGPSGWVVGWKGARRGCGRGRVGRPGPQR